MHKPLQNTFLHKPLLNTFLYKPLLNRFVFEQAFEQNSFFAQASARHVFLQPYGTSLCSVFLFVLLGQNRFFCTSLCSVFHLVCSDRTGFYAQASALLANLLARAEPVFMHKPLLCSTICWRWQNRFFVAHDTALFANLLAGAEPVFLHKPLLCLLYLYMGLVQLLSLLIAIS
jgi:hypothetical protein